MVRKTQSNVTVNAKLSSLNLQKIAIDGSVTGGFAEGAPVSMDTSNGYAALPTGCSPAATTGNKVVFINWVDSDRSDVSFIQRDPTDPTAPSMHIDGGGLSAIVGNMIDIGLPPSLWEGGALPTVGHAVYVNSAGTKFQAAALTAGGTYYGRVYRVYNGRAHFFFHSVPCVYA